MRDQHRPKQDLVNEVVALRKQVADLREEMAARCPIAASAPFARMLGYESAAELLSVSRTLGVFASGAERARVVQLIERGEERVGDVLFRRKDGGPYASWVMGAACRDPDAVALVALETLNAACFGDTHSG